MSLISSFLVLADKVIGPSLLTVRKLAPGSRANSLIHENHVQIMKCKKKMEFAALVRCSLVLLVCILTYGCDSTVSFEVAPYQIRVVDKATGQPVAGVLVVASFVSHVGTHGSTAGAANVQEAVTDADGVAHFAGWLKTDLEWGFDGREPTISTFERRYQSVHSRVVAKEQEWMEWLQSLAFDPDLMTLCTLLLAKFTMRKAVPSASKMRLTNLRPG